MINTEVKKIDINEGTVSVPSPSQGFTGKEETNMSTIDSSFIDIKSLETEEMEISKKLEEIRNRKKSFLNNPQTVEKGKQEFLNLMSRYNKSDWKTFLSYLGLYERKKKTEITNELIDKVNQLVSEGKTQIQIGETLDLSESTVSRIKSGKVKKTPVENTEPNPFFSDTVTQTV